MTSFTFRTFTVAALATIGSATAASAAPSSPLAEQRSAVVAFSDLDLATPKGVAALDRRISRAVVLVCGHPDMGNRVAVNACRAQARADALVRLARVVPSSATRLASAR